MPVVNFMGDRVFFPDFMSGEEVSDVLGAIHASSQAVGEFALTLGTGAAAEVVGGLTGLATGDANAVKGMQERLTYQPRTRAGQLAMQSIGQDISRLAESTGLNHLSGYWRDRVVPALQESAGPIAGSVLAAGGLAALTALGEVNPGGRVASTARRQIGAVGDLDNWFHGTAESFSKFDTSRLGSATGGSDTKHGFYLSKGKDTADNYRPSIPSIKPEKFKQKWGVSIEDAEAQSLELGERLKGLGVSEEDIRLRPFGSSSYAPEVSSELTKLHNINSKLDPYSYDDPRRGLFPSEWINDEISGVRIEAKIPDNMKRVEMGGASWDEAAQNRIAIEAKNEGFDGVIFGDMQDSGWFGGSGEDDIALVFDADKILIQD